MLLQILEPRDKGTVGDSVIRHTNINSNPMMHNPAFFCNSSNHYLVENYEKERNMMIKDKLKSFVKKRLTNHFNSVL